MSVCLSGTWQLANEVTLRAGPKNAASQLT
jgi:hypothetical protein